MSLPPATVKIKRKATDDPVDYLRIHQATDNGKRRRANDYIFSRQPTSTESTTSQTLPNSFAQPPRPTQPRRYHISRPPASSNTPSVAVSNQKRKGDSTIFVERRIRPKSAGGTPGRVSSPQLQGNVPQGQDGNTAGAQALDGGHGYGSAVQAPLTPTPEPEKPRQKRPGANARSAIQPARSIDSTKPAPAPLRNVRMPSGAIIPWDVSSERLAAEMQAYTLQEIGKTLAANEAARPVPVSSSRAPPITPTKFRPKKPVMRYAERHPEDKVDTAMDVDEEYIEEVMDDDSEYIIETYIRMPAEAMQDGGEQNIGLLVLDSQPDIEEFYREEEDSEEEEDDEEEDENAENHYTVDYPDEEVDSDDEFGRNAYNYRNHNASDLEEFDEDDATFSDDENENTRYPWMRKPVKKVASTAVDDNA